MHNTAQSVPPQLKRPEKAQGAQRRGGQQEQAPRRHQGHIQGAGTAEGCGIVLRLPSPLDQDQEQQRQQGQHTDQHRRGRDGAEQFGLWVQRGGQLPAAQGEAGAAPRQGQHGQSDIFSHDNTPKTGRMRFYYHTLPAEKMQHRGKKSAVFFPVLSRWAS